MTRSRVWRAIVGESVAGLGQKPVRTVLTMLGTILGVGAFVSVLGLTSTAAGQISTQFSQLAATTVTVQDGAAADQEETIYSFPQAAEDIVAHLNGVESCGIAWTIPQGLARVSTAFSSDGRTVEATVRVASQGYIDTLMPTWASGGTYTRFEQDSGLPVAILGASLARRLGVAEAGATVVINGYEWRVVGLLAGVQRQTEVMGAVLVPPGVGAQVFGWPVSSSPAQMLIHVRIGAAQQVAQEAPLALRPDQPTLLVAVPPSDPPRMGSVISGSMENLFVALAGVTLLIGAASIVNTTLVSVMERTGEIGLRRAHGAHPRHIITQFLVEAVLLGTVSGLVGASLGVVIVLATAVCLDWTAVLPPWTVASGPVIGALVGLLAGAYPAWRAGRIDPLVALRK